LLGSGARNSLNSVAKIRLRARKRLNGGEAQTFSIKLGAAKNFPARGKFVKTGADWPRLSFHPVARLLNSIARADEWFFPLPLSSLFDDKASAERVRQLTVEQFFLLLHILSQS
jgi:hypothetical protein